ncbi:MAG: type II toxin-antitoxin system HicB family antitoxin [Methanobacterium sp.]
MIIKLELPIELTKEDSLFIAICPVFCVGSQGKTEEEALNNAKEALQLYLEDEDVQKEHADKIMRYAVSLILQDKEKEFKSDIPSNNYQSNTIRLLDVEIHGNPETTKPLRA